MDDDRELKIRNVSRPTFAEMLVALAQQQVGKLTDMQQLGLAGCFEAGLETEADTIQMACAELVVRKQQDRFSEDDERHQLLEEIIDKIKSFDAADVTMHDLL